MLGKNCIDNILKYFSYFPQKITSDISCKLSLTYFLGKIRNIISLSSAEFAHSMVIIKDYFILEKVVRKLTL